MGLNNSIEKIRDDLSSITGEQRIKILEIFENEPILLFKIEVLWLTRDLVDTLIVFSENNSFVQWKIFQVQGHHRQAIIEYKKILDNPDYSVRIQQNAYLNIWASSIDLKQYDTAIKYFNIAKNWDDTYLSKKANDAIRIVNAFLDKNNISTKEMLFG